MSFLFALLPAATITSAKQAVEQHQALTNIPDPTTAPLPVVGIVCASIPRATIDLSIHRGPDGRGVILRAHHPDQLTCLLALFPLTVRRDLAIYEPHTGRLHNPRKTIRIPVTVSNTTFDYLTEPLLEELITTHPTVTLTREHSHIHIRRLPALLYELGQKTGREHFRLLTDSLDISRKTLWHWAINDPWWKEAIAWQPHDPRTRPTSDEDIDEVMAELRSLAAETLTTPTLDLLNNMSELDRLTQAIQDFEDEN